MACVCRQLIYNYPEQLFSDSGVMAIEHADFEGVERLALVTGIDSCINIDIIYIIYNIYMILYILYIILYIVYLYFFNL